MLELSADLFESTLHRIKGDGGCGGVERRIYPRVGLRCRIKLLPVVEGHVGAPLEVWTRDISLHGLGVISPKRLKIGTHYILSLPRDDGKPKLVLYCTVRNSEELVRNIHVIGFSFEPLRSRDEAAPSGAATLDHAQAVDA